MPEANPTTPDAAEPKQPPTLKDILDDKAQSAKFNVWLENQDKGPLVAKILERKFDKDDLAELAKQRKEFLGRQEQTQEMQKEWLNPTALKKIVESSTKSQEISELIGKDGLREVLESVLEDYSINREEESGDPANPKKRGDAERHKLVYDSFTAWKKSEATLLAKEEERKEYAKKHMLSVEEAEQISQITDKKERENQIRLRMEEKGLTPEGEERKWLFWKKPAWSKEQKDLLQQATLIFSNQLDAYNEKTAWTKFNEELTTMRNVLVDAQKAIVAGLDRLVTTKEGNQEIGRVLSSEKKPKEPMLSFGELKQEIERVKKPQAIEDAFFDYAEEEFTNYIDTNRLNIADDNLKMAAMSGFYGQFGNQLSGIEGKKGGIWKAVYDTIVAPLIQPVLDECLVELKGKMKDKMEIDSAKKTLKRKKKK